MSCNSLERTRLGLVGQVIVFVWMLSGMASAQSDQSPASPRTTGTETRGIAIVELFTSQGCSSCPPADAALRTIANVASKSQLPVYALSFHVDYWNRLGWKDPYSHAASSQRQRAYASAIKSNRIYTPQMIVNGTKEFLGSDRTQAHQAINQSLVRPTTAHVEIHLQRDQPQHQLQIQYEVSGSTRGNVLNLAAVHTPKPNSIPRGENSGRELSHVNVVRAFDTISLGEPAGTTNLVVPDNLDLSEVSLVAYVQNPGTLSVVGAAIAK